MTDLKKLADAATPGPWKWWTSNSWKRLKRDHYGNHENVLEPIVCSDKHPDLIILDVDMEYIAAANPQKILELLQEVETLRELTAKVTRALLDAGYEAKVADFDISVLRGMLARTRQETLEEAAKVCENHVTWLNYTNIGGANAEKMRTAATLLDAIRALQHTDGETSLVEALKRARVHIEHNYLCVRTETGWLLWTAKLTDLQDRALWEIIEGVERNAKVEDGETKV